jgi:hypothetical protein
MLFNLPSIKSEDAVKYCVIKDNVNSRHCRSSHVKRKGDGMPRPSPASNFLSLYNVDKGFGIILESYF